MRSIPIVIADNFFGQFRKVDVIRSVFAFNMGFHPHEFSQFLFLFVHELVDVFGHVAVVFIAPTAVVRDSFNVNQGIQTSLEPFKSGEKTHALNNDRFFCFIKLTSNGMIMYVVDILSKILVDVVVQVNMRPAPFL